MDSGEQEEQARMLERQRAYCDFLDDGVRFGLIKMRIHSFKHLRDSRYDRLTRQMGDEGGVRLIININDLQTLQCRGFSLRGTSKGERFVSRSHCAGTDLRLKKFFPI